ncbi:hypothetical protein Tco_0813166 [Tanacetum coccineum]
MRMKNDPHSQAIDPNIWKVLKAKFEKSSTPSKSCKHNVFCKRDHDDHLDDYTPREGEKEIDEDEEISEEASTTFLHELNSLGDKKVLTIGDHERMEATLKDMLSNQFKNTKEYAYHIKQAINYMENQIS